jgi:hypothetical protein
LATTDFNLNSGISVRAFPNPATEFLNIAVQSNNEKNSVLKLYDSNGRLMSSPITIENNWNENITKIPVNNLPTGFYFYTLSIDNKVVFRDKLIIQ